MSKRLNDEDSSELIFRATADCVNMLIDMRDAGAVPSDIMTALTQINVSVMAYVLVSADNRLNQHSVVRHMAKAIKDRLPEVIAQYREQLAKGREL